MPPGEIEFVTPHSERDGSGPTGPDRSPGWGVRWLVWGLAIAVAVAGTAVWLGNRPQPMPSAGAISQSQVPAPASPPAPASLPAGTTPAPRVSLADSGMDRAVLAPEVIPRATAARPVSLDAGVTNAATGCVATLMKRLFGMADAYRRSRAAGHSGAAAERAARDRLAMVASTGTRRYTVTLRSWTANRPTLVRGSGKLDLTGACGRDGPLNTWMQGAAGVGQAGMTG